MFLSKLSVGSRLGMLILSTEVKLDFDNLGKLSPKSLTKFGTTFVFIVMVNSASIRFLTHVGQEDL